MESDESSFEGQRLKAILDFYKVLRSQMKNVLHSTAMISLVSFGFGFKRFRRVKAACVAAVGFLPLDCLQGWSFYLDLVRVRRIVWLAEAFGRSTFPWNAEDA